MEGFELVNELDAKLADLHATNASCKRKGTALASAERAYREAKAQAVLRMKAQGHAVSLIADAVFAEKEVADALMFYRVAESDYKTECELVNILKRDVDILNAQISREWHSAGVVA